MDELVLVKRNKKNLEVINENNEKLFSNKNEFELNNFNCHISLEIQAHESDILCLEKYKKSIISGSSDKTIKIWDINTGKLINTLNSHNSAVHNLLVWDDRLISVSSDKTIKIWNLENLKLECTILAHTNHIYSITGSNDFFATSSLDKTIKFWNLKERKLLKVIKTGDYTAWSIVKEDNKLFAGLTDGSLNIYDFNSGELLYSYKAHNDSITSLKVNDKFIFTASKDKLIKIWDKFGFKLIKTITGHNNTIWNLLIFKDNVLSCSDDKTIKLWSINSGLQKQSLYCGSEWLSSLINLKNKIVTASGDGKIYILNKIPEYNCSNIDLNFENISKTPFETQEEFNLRQEEVKRSYYSKLINYEFINIGKIELSEDYYNIESEKLKCKLLVECPSIKKFSNLESIFWGTININRDVIRKIYSKSNIYNLYINYYFINSELDYNLYLLYDDNRYIFEKSEFEIRSKENKNIDIKQDRLNIKYYHSKLSSITASKNIRFTEESSVLASDTFRKTFESTLEFKNRISENLIKYGFINVGKAELLADKYSIESQNFPVKIEILSKKILNLIHLDYKSNSYININREKAKKMFEFSKKYNIYINFIKEENNLLFEISIFFNDEQYYIKL
jgi:hypothetical protein